MIDSICRWIARWLPKRLKYFVAMSVCAYATHGKYGTTEVPKLTFMEGIGRYQRDYHL